MAGTRVRGAGGDMSTSVATANTAPAGLSEQHPHLWSHQVGEKMDSHAGAGSYGTPQGDDSPLAYPAIREESA